MVPGLRPLAFLYSLRTISTCKTGRSSLLISRRHVIATAVSLITAKTLLHASSPIAFATTTAMCAAASSTGYLNAAAAASLDQELMSQPGFSLEQLMELAGLSVAEAVYFVLEQKPVRILLVCGPGNNGGDGLVAARHLVMFGHDCTVVYPKQSNKQHFINLVQQCKDVGISVLTEMPADKTFDVIVDAIFGFSFHGEPREPFASILQQIKNEQSENNALVVAVDVPSGWSVDQGDLSGESLQPDVLVSLTVPKPCARHFKGRHFVGGRFLPPALAEKYNIRMPTYPGVQQVVEITEDKSSWQEEYAAYLAEKEAVEFAGYATEDIGDESREHSDEQETKND